MLKQLAVRVLCICVLGGKGNEYAHISGQTTGTYMDRCCQQWANQATTQYTYDPPPPDPSRSTGSSCSPVAGEADKKTLVRKSILGSGYECEVYTSVDMQDMDSG